MLTKNYSANRWTETLRGRRAWLMALAGLAAAGRWECGNAQNGYPTGPLRLVVPFTPATGIDLIARTLGPRLAERLGQPVIVDNRPGASGNIGTEAVVHAPPNGQTLLVTVNTLVMNRSLYPGLSYDPVKDLMPVSLTSWGQLVLVTHPKAAFKTVAALVAAAKARPATLNYASPGVGTPHHLAMELFKATTGVFITHIPYRGTAPAVADLIGGQVDMMFLPIHVALPQLQNGRLVGLGLGSASRHALLPNLPTLSEAGWGEINVDMWYGIFAPKGSSAEWVTRLNREVQFLLALPEVRSAFQTQGMDPAGSTPEAFRQLVEKDAIRWSRLIQARHITAE